MNSRGNNAIYAGAAVAAAILTFFVFLPSLANDCVFRDDDVLTFKNPYIQSLDAGFF